jgi:Ca-activated chloride channel family protein
LEGLPAGRARIADWVDAILHGEALATLVVALSGPRLPLPTPLVTEGIAVELVVDVSGSMRETDFLWDGTPISRFDAVQRVFRLFIQGGPGPDGTTFPGRSQDLIGLVTFATYPDSPAPLTLSHTVLLQLLDSEQPRPLDEAQTNIGDAIAEALMRLEEAGQRRKILVLLTDGEHNFPGPAHAPAKTPRWAAQRAADLGVPIYAIDAGSDVGASAPEIRRAGKESLQEAARMTGGAYFEARDSSALLNACREIDKLERRPIDSPLLKRHRDFHAAFGLAALVFFLLARAWNATIGGRLP